MDENRVQGTARRLVGRVQKEIGRAEGDLSRQMKGQINEVVGAAQDRYRRRLQARQLTRKGAVALGSFGMLTRAIVFLMIAAFLAFAAYDANSREALGLSGALQTVQKQTYGGLLLAVAALGFCAFGAFEMIEASTRRVNMPRL